MATKKITMNELKQVVKQIIKENVDGEPNVDDVINSLKQIRNDNDLYNICYAISPKSIASGWGRETLLDTIYDILHSRLDVDPFSNS